MSISSLVLASVLVLLTGLAMGALVAWFVLGRQNSKRIEDQAPQEKERLEGLFSQLASDALGNASKSLVELAKTQLQKESEIQKKEVEMLVKPLAESLQNYKKEMTEAEAVRNKEYGSLDRLLRSVIETNHELRTETSNLVNALKRPTVRGRWGEVQLRRIVELSGMTERCDFTEQASVDGADGKLRPDLVVHLPNGRQIVIDSKAVLTGYLEAEASTDPLTRKAALLRHAGSVKSRIQELSRKNYWDQFKNAPEFVVLFIPGEMFFSAALEVEPGLIEMGFEQKVVLATPTTLMALLRAVAFGWRQEQLADNARKISEQASKIYQGLASWTGHLSTLGTSLDRACRSYNNAVGSLERTVMPPVRRLKEMGVSTKDELAALEPLDLALRQIDSEPDAGV